MYMYVHVCICMCINTPFSLLMFWNFCRFFLQKLWRVCVCVYFYVCICVCVCMYVCVCMDVYAHIYKHTLIPVDVQIFFVVFVCSKCAYVYVCILHTHTHTHTLWRMNNQSVWFLKSKTKKVIRWEEDMHEKKACTRKTCTGMIQRLVSWFGGHRSCE